MIDQPNLGWALVVSGGLIYAMAYFGHDKSKSFGTIVVAHQPRRFGRMLRHGEGAILLLPVVEAAWGLALAIVGIAAILGVFGDEVAPIAYAAFLGGAIAFLAALVATLVATRLGRR